MRTHSTQGSLVLKWTCDPVLVTKTWKEMRSFLVPKKDTKKRGSPSSSGFWGQQPTQRAYYKALHTILASEKEGLCVKNTRYLSRESLSAIGGSSNHCSHSQELSLLRDQLLCMITICRNLILVLLSPTVLGQEPCLNQAPGTVLCAAQPEKLRKN